LKSGTADEVAEGHAYSLNESIRNDLKCLRRFTPDAMEAAASAATILQLVSFTGEVLLAGYNYLSKVKKAPSQIRSLLEETVMLNALLDQLETLIAEDPSPHVMSALETLTSLGVFGDCRSMMKVVLQSIKTCEQISGQGARNFGRRLLWPFKEKDTKETLQQLGRLREALSAATLVDSTLVNLSYFFPWLSWLT
jgi:hypothetical protein